MKGVGFLLLLLAYFAPLGCSDSSGPSQGVGLRIIAGAGQTDTAHAALAQPLVVEVRDSSGRLRAGIPVTFQALLANGTPCNAFDCPVLFTGTLGIIGSPVTRATGSNGQASVAIRLSNKAGPATVTIAVPSLALTDTATFTITAASPAAVVAIPKDTALYVDGRFTLRGRVVDQYANPRPEAVTYVGLSAAATVDGGDTVNGRAIGRASYLVHGLGFTDTGWVSVVPPGTFAAMGPDGLAMMNLDGSGYRALAPSNSYNNGYASWGNPPTTLAFDFAGTEKLATVDTAGLVTTVLGAGDSGIIVQTWPSYSRDGSWIYFQGDLLVWKVHANGSGLARVSPPGGVDRWPSPSRDDSKLVLASSRTNSSNGLDIEILDLATDSLTSLGVNGASPRWSPTADSIAYLDVDGRVKILAANGAGLRAITPVGQAFSIALDWSPDGQWLLARDSYALELIEVSSGLVLPLGYGTSMSDPVWRP